MNGKQPRNHSLRSQYAGCSVNYVTMRMLSRQLLEYDELSSAMTHIVAQKEASEAVDVCMLSCSLQRQASKANQGCILKKD